MLKNLHTLISKRSILYHKWHEFRFHPHIHWGIFGLTSLISTLKIIAVILTGSLIIGLNPAYASSQTWTSESDWNSWTKSQTSSSLVSGSATLSSASQIWSGQTSGVATNLKDISCIDSSTCWTVGTTGTDGIIKTTNGGTSWSSLPSIDLSANPMTGVSFTSSTTGWAISHSDNSGYNIYKTTNGGTSWTIQRTDTDDFSGGCGGGPGINQPCRGYDIYMASSNVGWAVTQGLNNPSGTSWNSKILTTSNSGSTWTLQNSGANYSLWGVYGPNTTNAWAVGTNGTILTTSNGGTSWSAQTSGTTNELEDIFFVDTSSGWAVGAGGTILSTSNGGSTWSAQTSGTANTLYSVKFVSSSVGWATGASGTILTTSNGGSTWSAQASGTANDLYGIHMPSSSLGWVVGDSGTVKVYANTYNTPGYASVSFDGTNTYNNWQTLTKSETTNSQTIAYYAKTSASSSCTGAGGSWTGWSALSYSGSDASLSALSHTRYLCLGVNLSTSDTSVTPQVDALTLTYAADGAPTVSITSPSPTTCNSVSKVYKNTNSVGVAGSASDDTSVSSVTTSPSSTVTGTTSWSSTIGSLTEGNNSITATATDSVGQTTTSSTLTVNYDATAPSISISSPTTGSTTSTQTATITGTASDSNSGLNTVTSSASGTVSGTTSFTQSVTLNEGANTITMTATDCGGNTKTATITVTYTPSSSGSGDSSSGGSGSTASGSSSSPQASGDTTSASYLVGYGTGAVSAVPITWSISSGASNISSISIQYSTDSGSNWNTITTGLSPSTTTYSWTPTSLKSTNVTVKINFLNSSGTSIGSVTSGTFGVHTNSKPTISI